MTGSVAMMRHSKRAGGGVPVAGDAAAIWRQKRRAAIRLLNADRPSRTQPGRRPRTIRNEFGKVEMTGANGAATGTRALMNTSGPDFTWGLGPVKLRSSQGDPHRTKKNLVSSAADWFLQRASPFQNTIQLFDLMSRRHPLIVGPELT